MITDRIIEIGTSLFLIVGSGHFDLPKHIAKKQQLPYRRYHDFGNGGKSIIEFIHADGYLPGCVKFTGNYGCFNWSGLDLGANIRSIQKINYGEKVEY